VDFGTAADDRQKRTVLVDVVGTLARVLTRHGNRVGAIFYGRDVERTIPARAGRAQVLRLIRDLDAHPRHADAPMTDLTPLLRAARQAMKRRSLVFVISDFISQPGWERELELLHRRHEVIAIRLHDPRETDLPDVGALVVQDAETGEQLLIDTSDRGFRRRFAEAAEDRDAGLRLAFTRAGIDRLELSTDEDLVRAIVRMAARRRRRRH
jgi:uncharacterized protein (DUF58 family)